MNIRVRRRFKSGVKVVISNSRRVNVLLARGISSVATAQSAGLDSPVTYVESYTRCTKELLIDGQFTPW